MIKLAILLFLACIALIVLCNILVVRLSTLKIYDQVSGIPVNKVALVLGTAPTLLDGTENRYFTYRLDAAAELYHAGKVKYLLVSGDNHTKTYNEPEEMQKGLIGRGVPEERIYLDYAGFRTLDSIIRARDIFGQKRLTVVSQKFHNERAVYLASWFDVDAIGYNARDVEVHAGLKTKIRELFARVKVFVDLVTNKQPKFLGKPIEIPD